MVTYAVLQQQDQKPTNTKLQDTSVTLMNQKKIELILTFCPELPLTSALLPGPGPRTGAGRARGGARGIGAAALFLGCFVSVLIAGVQVIF